MSELQTRFIDDTYCEYYKTGKHDLAQVYLKSEADAFIAELEESHKKEVGQLLILNREQANAANRLRDSMEQALRHQKYKRCLAMAERCMWEQRFWGKGFPAYERQFQWENWAIKWKKRWLKLAEKFKEAK